MQNHHEDEECLGVLNVTWLEYPDSRSEVFVILQDNLPGLVWDQEEGDCESHMPTPHPACLSLPAKFDLNEYPKLKSAIFSELQIRTHGKAIMLVLVIESLLCGAGEQGGAVLSP